MAVRRVKFWDINEKKDMMSTESHYDANTFDRNVFLVLAREALKAFRLSRISKMSIKYKIE